MVIIGLPGKCACKAGRVLVDKRCHYVGVMRNYLNMDVIRVRKKRAAWWRVVILVALMLAPGLLVVPGVQAQGNLLSNPGFEQAHGDGQSLQPPPGWGIWANVTDGLVSRLIQRSAPEVVATIGVNEGNGALDVYKGWASFSVSVYQTVNVQAGSTLRLAASGRMWSCDSDVGASGDTCIADGSVVPQTYTEASFRVGIDPTGANDPNSGNIVWSNPTAPYAGYQQMTVDATASGTAVTVVLNGQMVHPARHQHVFWDSASLTVISGGSADAGTGAAAQPAAPAPAPPPALAAEVIPQGPRGDGGIVHTVRTGDTLWAIAVAYNVTPDVILTLNGMTMDDARILTPGQELIIQEGSGESAGGDSGQGEAASEPPAEPTEQPIESYDAAPVANAVVPVMLVNERVSTGRICTLLFEDTNPNRLRESGEALLAGGQITLSQGGATVASYTTDATGEPFCFSDLAPGDYLLNLMPPGGYGVTTPGSYAVMLEAGQTVEALFGAASGFVPPQPPPVQVGGFLSDETDSETDTRAEPRNVVEAITFFISDYAGVLVMVLAGVVLVGGGALTLLLRR